MSLSNVMIMNIWTTSIYLVRIIINGIKLNSTFFVISFTYIVYSITTAHTPKVLKEFWISYESEQKQSY